ncbi:MAG: DNA-binding transcriptional LysR family regulator [Phenylobacterium sp.]|jgi:DNA-binding transcriptional LysR family regulator
MDLKALSYFIAVYEKKSISAAAKACYIAQPSVSSAIKQLEELLQNQLFTRHARGVKPTEAGLVLYPLAKQLLGQADAIKSVFVEKERIVPFRLGLIRALGVDRMSLLLKEFSNCIEGLELTLVGHDESCDARIITQRYIEIEGVSSNSSGNKVHFEPMWQDDYVLVIPSNHPLGLKSSISLPDFHHLSLIQRTPCEAWEKLTNTLRERDIEVVIRAKIQTMEYALGLVKAGVGCALLPNVPQIMQEQDVLFKRVEGIDLSRLIGLAYQVESEPVKILKALVVKHSRV